jgi:hypothetical protein
LQQPEIQNYPFPFDSQSSRSYSKRWWKTMLMDAVTILHPGVLSLCFSAVSAFQNAKYVQMYE